MNKNDVISLGDLERGTKLTGVIPGQVVTVATAIPLGNDAAEVFYTASDGSVGREVFDADSISNVRIVKSDDGPAFDADPDEFRLAAEALRIKSAALYDPMSAVYSSDIDPLPHQIRAVYEDMLPQVPLRFLLADDPGAGKTVMAGLYIKEMLLRSAAERVIIVCPGGLAEQWHEELLTKFGLEFEVFQPAMQDLSSSGNPFLEHNRLIVHMDQAASAREGLYRRMLADVRWDIGIVDEAHRMSAHYKSVFEDAEYTKRFRLGEVLAETSENLLLMTATPHSGKESDFQLFMSLLDRDRFAGRYKSNKHYMTDTRGLMRRMVKEELLTFEGKPLFPERHAETVEYELSEGEASLYEDVTEYVRSGMISAKSIMEADGRRGNSIGFALTILQRRLASSPAAIYQSLKRRGERLSTLLRQIQEHPEMIGSILEPDADAPESIDEFEDMWDETDECMQGKFELGIEQVTDSATAARTEEELTDEIARLDGLIAKADVVLHSCTDTKWGQLSDILQSRVLNSGTSDQPHKMIVFTEHRDTLEYLKRRITTLLGMPEAVETIHGGMDRNERKEVQERFVNDPRVRILVATDAAGEGLNLQRADLMVNYDLPWNPNRIEQRFGRIHRIGQKRVCWLWNLVAKNTREGEVYGKLLSKIETMDKAYSGRLFNVLGEDRAFEGESLKELMLRAIQYGDDPAVQAELDKVIDSSVNQGLNELIDERSAHPDRYSSVNVEEVRKLMERTRERKLQPGYISAFFIMAFKKLKGTIRLREAKRWEITYVPADVRRKAEQINRHKPLAGAYERITFEPGLTHVGAGKPDALLIAPGEPLLDAVADVIIERYGSALDRGTVFVDRTDSQPDVPVLMMAAEQSIDDPKGETLSKHFDYLQLDEQGEPRFSPAPPYLDYSSPTSEELPFLERLKTAQWVADNHDDELRHYVYAEGTKPRLVELQARRDAENKHVLAQVRSRLNAEIEFWYQQYNECLENEQQDRPGKRNMNSGIALKRAKEFEHRLETRSRELTGDAHLHARPAVIRGVALVVPEHLIPVAPEHARSRMFARNTEEVDRRAVAKVLEAERVIGRHPVEMPHNNKGFDIRSTDDQGRVFFIEVKGRIDTPEADTFTVSANEVAFAQSQGDRHRLAIVRVSPDGAAHDRLRYVLHAFDGIVPSDSTRSFNETLADYWSRSCQPC